MFKFAVALTMAASVSAWDNYNMHGLYDHSVPKNNAFQQVGISMDFVRPGNPYGNTF